MQKTPKLWTPGDWNALFGFGTNILVNLLVLTGLLQFVLKMPPELVFGRILPALGLMMFLSTGYYAWLAYDLAKKTGRNDVCALPSGISVPHMFVVTFVIMLPIASATGDPVQGWEAGLVWVFFQSFILMIGGFVAPYIRHITPRAALLGTLAGVSIAFISMRPALEMFLTPAIGLFCLAVILVAWFGGMRYPRGIPAGAVAIIFGMIIAALMFAPQVTRIPQYLVVQKLGLIDTYGALIVPALAYSLGLFMMKQFMDNSVDLALIEAARIDGANEWTIFWRVVMPNVAPAWNTLLIFGFIAQWNDSFSPVVFTRSEAMKTVSVAMISLTNGPATVARLGAQSAAAFLMTAPVIIVFLLRQAKVIQTMAHSGIKA
jgi:ABC-type glycerol-3-phosphate transport system permease component